MNQLTDFLRSLRAVRETLHALAALGGYVSHLRGAALGLVLVMPGEWPEGKAFDEGRKEAKRLLGVPAKPVVRTAIALGYPAGPPRRGARKPISELVHEERYRA